MLIWIQQKFPRYHDYFEKSIKKKNKKFFFRKSTLRAISEFNSAFRKKEKKIKNFIFLPYKSGF